MDETENKVSGIGNDIENLLDALTNCGAYRGWGCSEKCPLYKKKSDTCHLELMQEAAKMIETLRYLLGAYLTVLDNANAKLRDTKELLAKAIADLNAAKDCDVCGAVKAEISGTGVELACECECETCKNPCVCSKCKSGSEWTWRGLEEKK